jgi:hypothetical protein
MSLFGSQLRVPRGWIVPVVVAASGLAACSGATVPPQNRPTPTPGGVCPNAIPRPPTMVSPPNGATGVADGNFNLILSYEWGTAPLALLVSSPEPPISTNVTTGSPEPVPSASPEVAYPVPALASGATVTVIATLNAGMPCAVSDTLGSFTTR